MLERTARRLRETETLDEAYLQQLAGSLLAQPRVSAVEIDRNQRVRGGRATSGSDHT